VNLVILDLMLPLIDGLEVLRRIRERSTMPVIILSAKDEETDRVIGLGMGADDYIVKPFFTRELVARVKAQLRRYVNYSEIKHASVLEYKDLRIDTLNYKVFKKDVEVVLTPKEYELLRLFISEPNRVFTKAQIFNKVWGDEYISDDNTIMVSIKRLRNKIEDNSNDPKYIVTVWGIGYKLGE
jgi:DNA-binding response OmpR family regulator